ncbi:MAG: sulfotransferase [Cyanobacteria bacterium P01_A01_bin.116]
MNSPTHHLTHPPTPDTPYLNQLSGVEFSPVFIMGDHRSGTTVLYKTLVATHCFNFVKAYHIIKYNEILANHLNKAENQAIQTLEAHFKALGISDRAIDSVIATPNLPEEYGFILKNVAGGESFITPQNLPIFQQLCRKIQYSSAPNKLLLLKNPWDFPHFLSVKQLLPTAKFIFIHRHPLHVMNSKLKAARTLLSQWDPYTALLTDQYAEIFNNPIKRSLYQLLHSKLFNLGLRRVEESSIATTTYFLENIAALPPQDYISIQYETLCKAPETTVQKILTFLNLESLTDLDCDSLIKPRSLKLLPEINNNADNINQKLQPYLTYHGY